MPRTTVSSRSGVIELEYVTYGDPAGAPLLLINGFTSQLTSWSPSLLAALVDGGFHVVTFDNRDCGLSTHLTGVDVDLAGVSKASRHGGAMPPVPYRLSDMAADAVGLLDALGIDRAHVLGVSLGGMVAQTLAIEHTARVRSLVSVMSSTGEWEFGRSTREAGAVLLAPPATDRATAIENSVLSEVWSSKRWFDPELTRAKAAAAFDRSPPTDGGPRQLAALYASGSRADALRQLPTPTLVIHGCDDTLILPTGGERTAEVTCNASLLMLADMGHDLPVPLEPLIVAAVREHARLADASFVAGDDERTSC